ncbi:MAG: glycine cleavage system aminomethyltransferase GcvT [Nitrospirae bacterium]|nr:glycine cleavage system aminomethyltransferase GcvT [Nitrospirota bacterium]
MKRTPLYEEHKKLGAKIVPFAGWEMPLSYTGVLEEHRATRSAVGLFDVSHMGRIDVIGPAAAALLDRVATSPVRKLAVGGMQYALACNEQGGILDDIMIYRFGEQRYFVCANASNAEKIFQWLAKQAAGFSDVEVTNRSAASAQIAVQGPRSRDLMRPLTEAALDLLKLRHCVEAKVAGVPMLLSRSGYTGELGYELYLPAGRAREVWETLVHKGSAYGLKPCGLGCRDTLRLEMGYPLYGNDMDETTTPIEASLEFAVDLEKTDFIGRGVMVRQKENGIARKLIGFELSQRGVPRHGHKILSGEQEIGLVSSGNHSPSLNKGIGMGYIRTAFAKAGGEVQIDIRGNAVPAVISERPFYKKRK